jgi:hypothetical protein
MKENDSPSFMLTQVEEPSTIPEGSLDVTATIDEEKEKSETEDYTEPESNNDKSATITSEEVEKPPTKPFSMGRPIAKPAFNLRKR